MTIELKAPTLPESVPDGTIAAWHKKAGETVERDEVLVDIETDKVVIEVPSPADGVLKEIYKHAGDTVLSNEPVGRLDAVEMEDAAASRAATANEPSGAEENRPDGTSASLRAGRSMVAETAAAASDAAPAAGPAARRLMEEHDLNPADIQGSGKGGRIIRQDVLDRLAAAEADAAATPAQTPTHVASPPAPQAMENRKEQRVPMSRLRARVAQRLLEASNSTAMLTTFNEINMRPVMEIRERHQQRFQETHDGVRLGYMSFFVRASIEALKRFPAVNASIDGNDIVYHGYQDIGVAVSSPRGLVVPVLRDADNMGFARIEREILEFGEKARAGKLAIEELAGGTFTISNGGIFGSLLSTPILNPPQAAILGMHKIQQRPMVVEGEIGILPMMYLALSYDHRLIDGKEAVQFLMTIKELLEDPARLVLEI